METSENGDKMTLQRLSTYIRRFHYCSPAAYNERQELYEKLKKQKVIPAPDREWIEDFEETDKRLLDIKGNKILLENVEDGVKELIKKNIITQEEGAEAYKIAEILIQELIQGQKPTPGTQEGILSTTFGEGTIKELNVEPFPTPGQDTSTSTPVKTQQRVTFADTIQEKETEQKEKDKEKERSKRPETPLKRLTNKLASLIKNPEIEKLGSRLPDKNYPYQKQHHSERRESLENILTTEDLQKLVYYLTQEQSNLKELQDSDRALETTLETMNQELDLGLRERKLAWEESYIKFNSLIMKPEEFDGKKPSPALWWEDYLNCKEANNWNQVTAVKYFC